MGACLQTGVPDSLRAVMLMSEIEREAWGQLEHSIRTGETAFDHAHGVGVFAYLQKHPDQRRIFDEAMTAFVSQNSGAVVAAYDFTTFSKVVDVGGGHGALMTAILKSSRRTSGVVFDQPSAIDGALRAIEAAELTDRCQCVGGDFFASVPAGGDAYILASIVHDWDDDHSIAILRNCRRAMSRGKTLLLVEMVILAGDAPFFGKLLDLGMLVLTGGRERTENEYEALLAAADFRLTRIVPTLSLASVIEAVAS
ncbi:MAG TPA: methyltransferase [Nitrospira sp.]|nr:methyltransferase [Nitrospira sp.]